MSTRIVQFAAVVLTAISLVPGGAHVLELANKLTLDQRSYFTVQQIYQGWAWVGAALTAAIAANVALVVLSRHDRRAAGWAALAAGLMLAMLVVFFGWTQPVNQATSYWSVAPADWQALRARWEYSHATSAALNLLALCAITLSVLSGPERKR